MTVSMNWEMSSRMGPSRSYIAWFANPSPTILLMVWQGVA